MRVDPAGTWPRAGGLQELAVITIAGNRAEIEAMLDSALLTDEEYAAGESVWRGYPDEFPAWR